MPPRVALFRLQLADFRNYERLDIGFGPGPIVLTGENGAGKTNLLEAISFLTPGRGLRRARLADLVRAGGTNGFAIHARIRGPQGEAEIGTGTAGLQDGGETGRRVRVNGANARSAEELLEWLRIIWITPAMDGLFTGPASDRRRFLDRLVLSIDPGHGRRAADFEKAMKSRNRLLEEGSRDAAWFEAIEGKMAETGIAIAAARRELVRLLTAKFEEMHGNSPFPAARILLSGTVEELIAGRPAIEAEETYRKSLASGRERDRAAGRTLEGPHRADLVLFHKAKAMPAALCSTGEQKALLVGTILSHAGLAGEIAGMAPILLLDEIVAHLDETRRGALFVFLEALNCQCFLTGTDRNLFNRMTTPAEFLVVAGGRVTREDAD